MVPIVGLSKHLRMFVVVASFSVLLLILIANIHPTEAKSAAKHPPNQRAKPVDKRSSFVPIVGGSSDSQSNKKAAGVEKQREDGESKIYQTQLAPMQSNSPAAAAKPSGSESSGWSSAGESSWNQHSLVPTFVDQEQGDEMIALASEIAESSLPRPATRSNKSLETRSKDMRSQQGDKQQPGDEYYTDDEDDDDELQMHGGTNGDAKQSQNRPPKGKQQAAQDQDYANGSLEAIHNGDIFRPELNQTSRSQPALGSSAKGWTPSESYPPTGNSAKDKETQQTRSQQQKQAKQQKQLPSGKKPAADKLVSLLGGAHDVKGAFSRTDMAIEYLRNILKSKQQQKSNSTNQESIRPIDMNAQQFAGNNTGRSEEGALTSFDDEHQLRKHTPGNNHPTTEAAKFSISDAKSAQQHKDQSNFYSSGSMDMTMSTKLPQESRDGAMLDKHPYQLGDLLAGLPAGATAFGGDYVDGVDESVRGYEPTRPQAPMMQQPSYNPMDNQQDAAQVDQIQRYNANRQEASDLEHSQSNQAIVEQHFSKDAKSANPAYSYQSFQMHPAPSPIGSNLSSTKTRDESSRRAPMPAIIQTAELLQADQPIDTGRKTTLQQTNITEISSSFSQDTDTQAKIRQITTTDGRPSPAQVSKSLSKTKQQVDDEKTRQQAEVQQQIQQTIPLQSTKSQPRAIEQPVLPPASSKLYREDVRVTAQSDQQLHEHQHQVQLQQPQRPVEALYVEQKLHGPPVNPLRQEHHPEQQQYPPQHQPQHHSQHLPHHQPHHQSQYPQQHPPQHPPQHPIQHPSQYPTQHPPHHPPQHPSQHPVQHPAQHPAQHPVRDYMHPHQVQQHSPGSKPPKLVGYNFYEGPSESSSHDKGEMVPTNFQLGDALYGSHGGVEHLLTNAELEAIQSQFLTAEHPIVPVAQHKPPYQESHQVEEVQPHQVPHNHHHHHHHHHHNKQQQHNHQHQHQQHQQQVAAIQDAQLAGLLAGLKSDGMPPEMLQKFPGQEKLNEESLASSATGQISVAGPVASAQPLTGETQPSPYQQPAAGYREPAGAQQQGSSSPKIIDLTSELGGGKSDDHVGSTKKKSLIVYLNHPRSTEMPRGQSAADEAIAQSVFDQYQEPFVTAKEFDSHGLSKDGKHLNIASLRSLSGGDSKEGLNPDKDGLSVVVIGDAYKYKKIVLLISSKNGGLKFIPMVKDMKK